MKYEAWTAKDVEHRVLEAAETLMLMPNAKAPESVQSIWREATDDYGKEKTTYRRRPQGAAIDRMYETWNWINALESEPERKLIYAWSYVKTRKGMTLSRFASENLMNDRMLRRKIDHVCQVIANNLNRLLSVRLTVGVDDMSENTDNSHQQTVSSKSCVREYHWRAADAKPQHKPALHEQMNPAK